MSIKLKNSSKNTDYINYSLTNVYSLFRSYKSEKIKLFTFALGYKDKNYNLYYLSGVFKDFNIDFKGHAGLQLSERVYAIKNTFINPVNISKDITN